jgi:hypothetical protein
VDCHAAIIRIAAYRAITGGLPARPPQGTSAHGWTTSVDWAQPRPHGLAPRTVLVWPTAGANCLLDPTG